VRAPDAPWAGSLRASARARLMLLLGAALACAACATKPSPTPPERIAFTQQLRAGWVFSDAEIRELQFYTHEEVVLERDLGGDSRSVVHGRLVVREGHNVELVEIPAGTPGIATVVTPNAIAICFEGACDATLTFQYPAPPNYPDFSGSYVAHVDQLRGNSGRVTYGALAYILHPLTYLEIDVQSLQRLETRRQVPGKRIGEKAAP